MWIPTFAARGKEGLESSVRIKNASTFDKIVAFLQKLVMKVDQLIKRRAQQGLIAVNVDWAGAQDFVKKHIDQEFTVSAIL